MDGRHMLRRVVFGTLRVSALSKSRYSSVAVGGRVLEFVEKWKSITQPANVHICTGSEDEGQTLIDSMIASGTLSKLNPQKRPNSYLACSSPLDVARVEERTFIASEREEDAGPTNYWRDPVELKAKMTRMYTGSMAGRTMYVIPFSMGPVDSPISHIGVQLTDSPYVAYSMRIMTRVGQAVWERLGEKPDFVQCVHSVGFPLSTGVPDVPWPCDVDGIKYISHFPSDRMIWSYGSGYGGNALLGKKCFALRIASTMGRDEGWLAEHMLILSVTNPQGEKKYIAAAFPSACGKTNLAMMQPSEKLRKEGWSIKTVGDDIAWMKLGSDGRLYAINPEFGFFGVAPGTSTSSNPHAMNSIQENVVFTNVAKTADGDVWWDKMTDTPPEGLTSWKGTPWQAGVTEGPPDHPNARFTVPIAQCPVLDDAWNDPQGVPISAVLLGGRRSDTIPLVTESFDWEHGVFMGATMRSETTAAKQSAGGQSGAGQLRYDPFAMLPFCGYHMGDYFKHWLSFVDKTPREQLPSIYMVNWFQKDGGNYIWPGFGENARVLKWIFGRVSGDLGAEDTVIGRVPKEGDLDVSGLTMSEEELKKLSHINVDLWKKEVKSHDEFLQKFGDRLPARIGKELHNLKDRLKAHDV